MISYPEADTHYICMKTVFRKISGPEKDEACCQFRILHSEEIHDL